MSEEREYTEEEKVFLAYKARLNENPRDIEAATTLGNIYYDANEPAQAILYYRLALDINPDLPGVRTDMGTMYWANENFPQAELAYRKVIDEHPGFGNAYLNLGYLLMHVSNDVQRARAIWTALIKDWPQDPAADKIREMLLETMN